MVWTDFLIKSQFYGPIVPMKPTMTMILTSLSSSSHVIGWRDHTWWQLRSSVWLWRWTKYIVLWFLVKWMIIMSAIWINIWSLSGSLTTIWYSHDFIFILQIEYFFKPRNHIHFWIFLVCTKPWYVQNGKERLSYSMNIKFIILYYIIYCIYIILLVFHKLYW